MKLSKIYSNQPNEFPAIDFSEGLNVVLAEIREPDNSKKDTHNLGKTTLSKLIDYCFLKGRSGDFFIFKENEKFAHFIFFLEIDLGDGDFLTIRRYASADKNTKISFKKHNDDKQDFSQLGEEGWNHYDLAFDQAKTLFDSYLDLTSIKPWKFRDALSYFLRVQKDYNDVFQLSKFVGKHADWKPYLVQILGFNGELSQRNYQLSSAIGTKDEYVKTLKGELHGQTDDLGKIDGMILIKNDEIEKAEDQISHYDFQLSEAKINKKIVEDLEVQISRANKTKYRVSRKIGKINKSLETKKSISVAKVEKIFKEAKIYFGEQIKKDYQSLENFNTKISKERQSYLKDELKILKQDKQEAETLLTDLNSSRTKALELLEDTDTFSKYKALTIELTDAKADLEILNRQKESIEKIKTVEKEIRDLETQQQKLKEEIEEHINASNGIYDTIRTRFNYVVESVIDKNAVLSLRINKEANIEFSAEILGQKGTSTSASDGNTYKKFLCIAFDLAVLSTYADRDFIKFVYHDGIFETLDDRKKFKLIKVIREFTTKYGIQHIITSIDSDMPYDSENQKFSFDDEEICKVLHDEGRNGRLFQMDSW